ncbi:hypothetical protein yc1106_01921 [Curvularia clavata]|uniref:EF-hand domain-containing protein n=1 Tax=Curvularia clavata TaxID=95742 RepID=A0A9Q9DPK9_CURCL|nr:hypothetical protein yc1106_01921 [Curvularia clavata]
MYSAPPGFPPPPQQPAPPPSGWTEHLFYTNGKGTPAFEALMKEFFVKLDPRGTGYITPEAFSSFLEASLVKDTDNVWKRSLNDSGMYSKEDMADFELKAAIEGFLFDHKVVVRNPSAKQLSYGGMPLLSLAGFTDFMSVEYAADPDNVLPGINNALRVYNIWPERGPLPRYAFPARTPLELQQRLDQATQRCAANAKEKLRANQARIDLELLGQQNAVDLIDGTRRSSTKKN